MYEFFRYIYLFILNSNLNGGRVRVYRLLFIIINILSPTDSCQTSPTAFIAAAADDALTASSERGALGSLAPNRSRLFTVRSDPLRAGWVAHDPQTTEQYIQVRREPNVTMRVCMCVCTLVHVIHVCVLLLLLFCFFFIAIVLS